MAATVEPPSDDAAAQRWQQLVDVLKARGVLASASVEAAFRAVPRHLFLPGVPLERVYGDQAITTKVIDGNALSSSSQPAIMATMLEQLDLRPGQSVLEVGAATGYNAALMAHLVGSGGRVVTMDIDEDLVAGAREHLVTAGIENVEVVCGDGAFGRPAGAPYDRIIVTAGAWDIAPAWREQLTPGGRLVLPLWLRSGHLSIAFDHVDGVLRSRSARPCGFLMLRGAMAGPATVMPVAMVPGLQLSAPDATAVSAESVAGLLASEATIRRIDVAVGEQDGDAINLWITLREPACIQWWQTVDGARQRPLPALRTYPDGSKAGVALVTSRAVSLLATGEPGPPGPGHDEEHAARTALVHEYGAAGEAGERLCAQLLAWDAAGRPRLDELSIRAYPAGDAPGPTAGEVAIDRPHSRLVIGWGDRTG